ncbi:MAG: hypothetical protein ACR2MQ_06975, partial [Gemmatimonadaceae bacterium]
RDDVLVILEPNADLPLEWVSRATLIRPADLSADAEEFALRIGGWLSDAANRLAPQLAEEPARLLAAHEYRASVISAVALLEYRLRLALGKTTDDLGVTRVPLNQLLRVAARRGLLPDNLVPRLRQAVDMRNRAVHEAELISAAVARTVVRDVMAALGGFPRG